MKKAYYSLVVLVLLIITLHFESMGQIVTVGSGSYTTQLPPPDAAGRNQNPTGTPRLSGAAVTKPRVSSDWWTGLLTFDGANLYNYPLSLRALNNGLIVSYTAPGNGVDDTRQPMSGDQPILAGVSGLSTTVVPTVSDYSDWTVTANWASNGHSFNATMGMGMPFVYCTKGASDVASVTINMGTISVQNEMILVTNSEAGANFAIYAPVGSTWTQTGTTYTSTLAGKNYYSIAMLPPGVAAATAAADFKQYAYVFPANTSVSWTYNNSTSTATTTFSVTTDKKEGTATNVLVGLLPHQWAHLGAGSPSPGSYSYPTVRGTMKMLAANSFTVDNKFKGVLPSLPNTAKNSSGFDPGALASKVDQVKGDGLQLWTDSYNDGLAMNRLIQVARIADQQGNTAARDQIINTVKARLEMWLKADAGENAFLFYYNNTWSTLIGFPAGYYSDANLNDHHFHYGYFINAAAAVEQFQPGWAASWGGMVNMLVKDAANWDKTDTMFPFLRNFHPYAGHSFATGLLNNEPHGNNQESSSEAMNFNASLIQWGVATGNTAIRDLGIYLYTTEATAIDEYWFDVSDRNFPTSYNHPMTARVWGNGIDKGTFWTNDIAAMYGIEMVPMTGGSFYLGHNTANVTRIWNDMKANTGVLTNTPNDNLWYDVYWQYLSLVDPATAISLYNNYPNHAIKGGESDANTYNWLHAFNGAGQVDGTITANHPLAVVFNKAGNKTYVAYNYSASAITVTYSDGFSMSVPARSMKTNKDIDAAATLTSSASQIPSNATVTLTASVSGTVTKVEFYNGTSLIGTKTAAPYTLTTAALPAGKPNFYVRVYNGTNFNLSNVVRVFVGSQLPFGGTAWAIPGTFEAGNYDSFEGGVGQEVSYFDTDVANQAGAFRSPEYVDAGATTGEGNTVGWINDGEWLEYTVNVATAGTYDVTLRYTSGNSTGGGPFWFENAAGTKISPNITVAMNDVNWTAYANKVVNGVTLSSGTQVIRVKVGTGGFNLGKMTFTFVGGGDTTPPSVPTNLASPSKTSTSVDLTWTASTDNVGVTGYEVYVNTETTPRATVTTTSATISGLSLNTTYAFKVRAKDAVPNFSAYSGSINVTTNGDTQAPTAPTNLASPSKTSSSVDLTWTASTDNVGVTGYEVYVNTETTPRATVTTTSATISGLSASTTYAFKVRAKDAVPNFSAYSSSINVTTGAASSLPSPWVTADIGSVGVAGSASYSAPTFTAQGSGSDIWDVADGFRYIYQPVTGDVTITARVATLGTTDPWAKAGVMVRETTAANSAHALSAVTSGNGTAFQNRLSTGAASNHTAGPAGAAPYWVRMVRTGNVFTSFVSTNGTTWTQIGAATTITMASTVQVGLAVTAHNNTVLNTATFDNVTVTTGTGNIAVTGVSMSPTSASVNVGGTTQLTATITPSNATNKTVTWSTSNSAIATVSNSGLVTGVAAGSCTITVTTQDGGKTATSAITVNTAPIAVTGVTLSRSSATIGNTGVQQLTATVAPSNATNKTVTWSTSNSAIATVNSSGLVTAVAAGTATITVTTQDGGKTATCAFTIINGPTFFQDCPYGGTAVGLATGTYTTAQLSSAGIANNWISSLKVPAGYTVTLYDGDAQTGTNVVLTADNSCLTGNSFNDLTSSIKIAQSSGVCTGNGPIQSGQSVADYSYEISTSGNVNVKFIAGTPIAGCDLVIFYYRIGTGGYAGFTMTQSGSTFTTSVSIPNGSAIQFYFTYRRSAGGMESNSSATPHSYTVGTTCAGRLAQAAGVNNPEHDQFDVYPNPASARIYLKTSEAKNGLIKIIDRSGRELPVRLLDDGSVDVSELPSGMYTIMRITNRERLVRKFVKE